MMFLTLLLGVIAGTLFVVKDWIPVQSDAGDIEVVPSTETPEPRPTATSVALAPTAQSIVKYTLFVPAIGVYAPIVELFPEGTSWSVAYLGGANVGHLSGTSALDTSGNSVVVGHVEMPDGSGGVFKALHDLKIGDSLVVKIDNRERWYVVQELRTVAPDDLSVLYPTPNDILTLITCDEYDFISGVYRSRFVVVAGRVM